MENIKAVCGKCKKPAAADKIGMEQMRSVQAHLRYLGKFYIKSLEK